MELTFQQWYASGTHNSAWTTYTAMAGTVSVYVRRAVVDRRVVEVGNIVSRGGWGAGFSFYRSALRGIPAVAEIIVNPALDALLERWGWVAAPTTDPDSPAPTRVNPAFLAVYGPPLPAPCASTGVNLALRAHRDKNLSPATLES